MIHLQQNGLILVIDEYIQANNMKSHAIVILFRLAAHIVMPHLFIPQKNSLNGYFFNLLPYFIRIYLLLCQTFHNSFNRSLKSPITLTTTLLLFKLWI